VNIKIERAVEWCNTGSIVAEVVLVLMAVLATGTQAMAAFDLISIRPEERGSATALALAPAGNWADSSGGRPLARASVFGFKPFGMREIDFAAVSAEIPLGARLRKVVLSFSRLDVLNYCEEVYSASSAFAAGSAVVTPTVRAGLAKADGDLQDWALLFDIAAEAEVSDALRIRACFENPMGWGLLREGSRCPARVSVGAGAAVAPDLTFGIEITKTAGYATAVASGLEFAPANAVRLRAGLRTYPKEFTFGAGVRIGRIAFDVGSGINLALGVTHEAGVTLFWKERGSKE